MKFTKLTILALLLALLVCAIAACGGVTETEAPDTNAPDTNAPDTQAPDTDPVETEHVHDIEVQVEEATCQDRGYTREVCKTCDEMISVKPIDLIDHVEKAPATCTEASVCKFCEGVIAPATGHTMGDVTESKEATETEAGYTKAKCTVCGLEVTTVIPAGIGLTFDDMADGALVAESIVLKGFSATLADSNGAFTIVSDGANKYLAKAADNKATLTLKDDNGILKTGKFAISFDYRLDSATTNSGILSFKNDAGKEKRVLSHWNSGGFFVKFSTDNGANVTPALTPESQTWYNLRVVVDPSTMDYEVYVNGEKVLYTTYDETAELKHVAWTLDEAGQWISNTISTGWGKDKSPMFDPAEGIASIYLFHWSGTACSIDNFRIELPTT